MSIPERTPNGIKSKERGEQERRSTFWREVDNILKTRDPNTLESMLKYRMNATQRSDETRIDAALEVMKNAHKGQKRRTTGESYILHPLQVTLIYLEIMHRFAPPDTNLVLDTDIEILLNHDVLEDTEITLETLAKKFKHTTVNGIDALSHSGYAGSNGGKLGHAEYIERIFQGHNTNPSLRLLSKKVADFIANANDPRDIQSLFVTDFEKTPILNDTWIVNPLSFPVFEWEGIVNKKMREMSIFLAGLAPEEADSKETRLEKAQLAQLLDEAIEYTRQSKEKGFTVDSFLETLLDAKEAGNRVYLTDAERRFLSPPYKISQK